MAFITTLLKTAIGIIFVWLARDSLLYVGCQQLYELVTFPIKPVNLAKMLGDRMEMTCDIGGLDEIRKEWVDYVHIIAGRRISLDGKFHESYPYKSSFELFGKGDLALKAADPAFAGQYACREVLSDVSQHLFLIVLGAPTCLEKNLKVDTPVEEGDMVIISCSVNYTGAWGPIMEWLDGKGNPIYSKHLRTNTSVTYNFSHLITYEDTKNTFKVKISFPEPPAGAIPEDRKDTRYFARNAPDYTFIHQAARPPIHYSPMNLKFNASGRASLPIGSYLECSAEASPEPISYAIYVGTIDNIFQNTSILKLEEGMAGEHIIGCIAKNMVKGKEKSANIEELFHIGVIEMSTTNIVLIVVFGIIGLIFIGALVGCYLRKKSTVPSKMSIINVEVKESTKSPVTKTPMAKQGTKTPTAKKVTETRVFKNKYENKLYDEEKSQELTKIQSIGKNSAII